MIFQACCISSLQHIYVVKARCYIGCKRYIETNVTSALHRTFTTPGCVLSSPECDRAGPKPCSWAFVQAQAREYRVPKARICNRAKHCLISSRGRIHRCAVPTDREFAKFSNFRQPVFAGFGGCLVRFRPIPGSIFTKCPRYCFKSFHREKSLVEAITLGAELS